MAARRTLAVCGLSAVLLLAGACEAVDWPDEAVTERSEQLNGIRLNGIRLNGGLLGGDPASGDYIDVQSIDLHGSGTGTNAWLAGSELFIESSKGGVRSGAGLEKTRISIEVQEGDKGKKGKIVEFTDFGALAPGSDVAVYTLKLKDGGWQSLCEDGTDVILLGDLWDPATGDRLTDAPSDAVTLACRGAALAKCVEFGYRPWASVDGVSLRDHHQACTRMVRADYCGDGTPHTTDGTPLHVLDLLGIQTEDPAVDYEVEAEWGPDGAVCFNAANARHPVQALACDIPACDESFAAGGLIQSGTVLSP